MSSVTINKQQNSSAAFAALEEAIADLESAAATLVQSITRENGAPFSRVQTVWEAQKCLSTVCRATPVRGGDDLWPRVRVAKRTAEAALGKSRRFHELWKQREAARRAREVPRTNGVRPADPPAPVAPGRWEFRGEDSRVLVAAGVDGCVHVG